MHPLSLASSRGRGCHRKPPASCGSLYPLGSPLMRDSASLRATRAHQGRRVGMFASGFLGYVRPSSPAHDSCCDGERLLLVRQRYVPLQAKYHHRVLRAPLLSPIRRTSIALCQEVRAPLLCSYDPEAAGAVLLFPPYGRLIGERFRSRSPSQLHLSARFILFFRFSFPVLSAQWEGPCCLDFCNLMNRLSLCACRGRARSATLANYVFSRRAPTLGGLTPVRPGRILPPQLLTMPSIRQSCMALAAGLRFASKAK